MALSASQAMAVHADHVALRGLNEKLFSALQGRPTRAEIEALLTRIAVVEVHLVSCESSAAIEARDIAKPTKEFGGGGLAFRDALDLAIAVRRVVPDVCRSLTGSGRHEPF